MESAMQNQRPQSSMPNLHSIHQADSHTESPLLGTAGCNSLCYISWRKKRAFYNAKRNIVKRTNLVAVAVASILLSACNATLRKPPLDIGEAAGKPDSQVIMIATQASESFYQSIMTDWTYMILAVDGVPVPKETRMVRLTPGTHTFTYTCFGRFGPKDTGGVEGKGDASFTLKEGYTYWGRIHKELEGGTSYRRSATHTDGVNTHGSCKLTTMTTARPR